MKRTMIAALTAIAYLSVGRRALAQNCNLSTPCIETTQTGTGNAIYAQAAAASGIYALGTTSGAFGVYGANVAGGTAIYGLSTDGLGVDGESGSGTGVTGKSQSGIGVSGVSASAAGVEGIGNASGAYGVYGVNPAGGTATYGFSATGFGVSTSGTGVTGTSQSGVGVSGASSTSNGVFGLSQASGGYGVYGQNLSSGGIAIYGDSTSGNGVVGQNSRTDWNAAAISAVPGNTNGLGIYCGGGAEMPGGGMWGNSSSDARVKKDIKDFHPGLAELVRLHAVRYKYNGLGGTQDDGHEFVGVIAQELEKVMPEMVKSRKAKLHPGDAEETDIKRVDPNAFLYILINAVQEQQRIIGEQDARIARLERGRPSLVSSLIPGGFGIAALGLVPLGLVVGRNRRKSREAC
jgi:hypothetical protein